MTTGPTPEQAAAQVALIRRDRQDARVIGIHAPGPWLSGTTLTVQGETFPVAYCTSALQVSEALVSHPADAPPLVLITPLEDGQLSLDVRARLAGRQLYHIDRWQMVRDLFRAREIDPRLPASGWFADALVQHMPAGGYPPVASGLLDADTAWTHLLTQHLGLCNGRPDAVALLAWSVEPQHLRRYEGLSAELRAAVHQRLRETAGAVGATMLDALEAGHGGLLLPIGLVCEVLFAPSGQRQIGIAQARARLEAYLGGQLPVSEVGQAWFAAAASVLATLSEAQAHDCHTRAEQLLTDLKATEYASLSGVMAAGFTQRLQQFATALQGLLRGKVTLHQVEERFHTLACHREAARQAERLERVRMALRLARFLATGSKSARPASLSQAAMAYAEHGGYVDWARRHLIGGDETAELAAAFRLLANQVRQTREQQNKQFADLLATWNKAPRAVERLVPIEQALAKIVAGLARSTSVLLLVIDAMSYAVCRELCEDFRRHGWIEWTDQPGHSLPLLLGTVPSVTEMSRASLFAGKLIRGNSATEKRDFATHTDLLAVSHPAYPPVVFHKGEIIEAGAAGISETVREALQNAHQKVVGVVLNAVDDHLAKSEQLRFSWNIGQFQYLDALLYEARLARRAIVLTSDHGHVLEDGARQLQRGTEERWRAFEAPLATAEMAFAGPRVEGVTGMPRIIALWSETARYSRKKQGYHGGATPQEVLVPLVVLTPRHASIMGWEALPEHEPAWWSRAESVRRETPAMPVPPTPRPKKSTATQGSLFATAATGSPRQPQGDWLERLLDSPVFAAQQRLAGRKAPNNAMVRAALKALDGQQDGLSHRMLGQVLGLAELQVRGLLAGLQRLLNVDGYQVIVVDEASGIVELNRRLLDKQFQLLRG